MNGKRKEQVKEEEGRIDRKEILLLSFLLMEKKGKIYLFFILSLTLRTSTTGIVPCTYFGRCT